MQCSHDGQLIPGGSPRNRLLSISAFLSDDQRITVIFRYCVIVTTSLQICFKCLADSDTALKNPGLLHIHPYPLCRLNMANAPHGGILKVKYLSKTDLEDLLN